MHGLGNVVDVGEAQNARLKKKIHLHDLELDFYVEDQFQEKGEESRRRIESDLAVLNALEPPSHLEKLSIKSFIGTTVYTNWMTSLTNLKSLHIDGCWQWQLECLPPLGKLQELNILGCSILEQRCEREIGDYWPIISHIPTINMS
uniref:R13L1/DRL21-like LRR repeat region domain-containing protein n=2 Tax=Quercus lobata TaxID=97700 RepID=A0A7N2R5W7_QUELO